MSLNALEVVNHLTLIDGGRKKGRPSKEDEARLDLLAHRAEEKAAAEAVLPLLRRLELLTYEAGPAAHQLVSAVSHWHERHGRRWSGDDGAAA
jgi:hypothetical protein